MHKPLVTKMYVLSEGLFFKATKHTSIPFNHSVRGGAGGPAGGWRRRPRARAPVLWLKGTGIWFFGCDFLMRLGRVSRLGHLSKEIKRRCLSANIIVLCFLFVLVTCRSRVICKKVASRSGTIGAQSEN